MQRRYRLHWAAPQEQDSAPVRRFIVAAFDPAYGKALTIATLEPDYSEEFRCCFMETFVDNLDLAVTRILAGFG